MSQANSAFFYPAPKRPYIKFKTLWILWSDWRRHYKLSTKIKNICYVVYKRVYLTRATIAVLCIRICIWIWICMDPHHFGNLDPDSDPHQGEPFPNPQPVPHQIKIWFRIYIGVIKRIRASVVGGEHSRKDPFEVLANSYFRQFMSPNSYISYFDSWIEWQSECTD